MTKERMFYIAYQICNYIRQREMQNQFEEYEFCMYVSCMVDDIKYSIENNDNLVLKPYYDALNNELDDVSFNEEYVKEVNKLIKLLDECSFTD